ncbi:MAG: disulfide bond formation protein B [Oceanospirillaceae bacterium]
MLKLAANFCRSSGYWLLIFLFALSLELIALYFQYQLGYGPCVLCVEIRAIVFSVMVIALIAIFACHYRILANLMNLLLIASGVGLYLKSNYLLLIERNLVEGSCGFKPNFPTWLPLDEWIPSVFQAWEACGYTPMLWLEITMAEGLIYCSWFVIALGAISLLLNLFFGKRERGLQLFNS